MPDITSLASTIAGTRARVPEINVPGGGGGMGGRGMIQENVGQGKMGEAMGMIGAAIFGKKLQERNKSVERGIKFGTDIFENEGFIGTEEQMVQYQVDVMKNPKDSAKIVTKQLVAKYGKDPETGLIKIPSKTETSAKESAYGAEVGAEKASAQFFQPRLQRETETATATATASAKAKFAQEKVEQPTRLEWAKQDEQAKQGIVFDTTKKIAALEDSYKQIDEARQIKLGIQEENRKRETPEGKLDFENAQEELNYRKLSGKKMRKDIQVMEVSGLRQSQEDFYKDMDATHKYISDNFPTLIDSKTKMLKPVKEGSEEYATIDKVFAQFGHTPQWNIIKDKTFKTNVVAPFVLSPEGALLESNKIPKSKPVELSPEQQKFFEEKKKKFPNMTKEDFLAEVGGTKPTGKSATAPITTSNRPIVSEENRINQIGERLRDTTSFDMSDKEIAQQAKKIYDELEKPRKQGDTETQATKAIRKFFEQPSRPVSSKEPRKQKQKIDYYSLLNQ